MTDGHCDNKPCWFLQWAVWCSGVNLNGYFLMFSRCLSSEGISWQLLVNFSKRCYSNVSLSLLVFLIFFAFVSGMLQKKVSNKVYCLVLTSPKESTWFLDFVFFLWSLMCLGWYSFLWRPLLYLFIVMNCSLNDLEKLFKEIIIHVYLLYHTRIQVTWFQREVRGSVIIYISFGTKGGIT